MHLLSQANAFKESSFVQVSSDEFFIVSLADSVLKISIWIVSGIFRPGLISTDFIVSLADCIYIN